MFTVHVDRRTSTRRYLVGNLTRIEDILSILGQVSSRFMLFLALDASSISDQTLRSVARALIDRGMSYLCVWGNECSRVHDEFDLERGDEPDGHVVMTTWHDDEPLAEALWFFANVAYPDSSFEAECRDWVAISIGSPNLERQICEELIDNNEGWPP